MKKETREMIKFYDAYSDTYDDFNGPITTNHYLKKEVSIISKYLKEGTLVELGGGNGKNILALSNNKIKTKINIDISFKSCKQNPKEVLNICANVSSLPFQNNTLDNVLMFLFIHHFNFIVADNFDNLLKVLKQTQSSGGKIFIKESNRFNPVNRVIHFIIKEKNMVNITPLYLLKTLKSNDYIIEAIIYYGFMPPGIPEVFYKLFCFLEKIIEKIPLIKFLICSHYIIVAKKGN